MKVKTNWRAALIFAVQATFFVSLGRCPGSELAFDQSGNLFFEARNTGVIFKYAPDGTRTAFANSTKDTAINGDLAVDMAGNVFACANSTTILKYTPDGTRNVFARVVGKYWPDSLAVDTSGDLFASSDDTIFKFTPDGTKSTFAKGVEAYAMAFDRSNDLFACDGHGENGHLVNALIKFAPDGSKTIIAPGMQCYGLAVDRSDNLFVVGGGGIFEFTPEGTKTTFVGGVEVESLAFDPAGNLLTSDGNNKISKFAPDGTKKESFKGPPTPGATEEAEDSADGLPDKYAKDYLVSSATVSPDKKLAVIYPTRDDNDFPEGSNYVVSLKPFAILGKLKTEWPYFKNESHGGLSADWSKDSSIALVMLDGRWGPHDIFLLEFHGGKLARTTTMTAKMHDLLVSDYRKAKAKPYNEYFDFILESEDNPICELDGSKRVQINALVTTDPKGGGDERVWEGRLKATWDIAQAKFTSQKVTRRFAGIRKHGD